VVETAPTGEVDLDALSDEEIDRLLGDDVESGEAPVAGNVTR
jgi:hypothetical protein